ncbi:hypothetical protein D9619_006263 [Psilocybe cf. subviscida]|uniref:Arsenite methyltransferase n=1 Tax=Psilocybe cf. subviscida TaxID=2480587 RepID=A0A8H5B5G8_9AGAR|nr:hypothetical protein D9619_006263 [Psilocybe cf. subviscida]
MTSTCCSANNTTKSMQDNANNNTDIVGIVKEAYSTKAREGVPAEYAKRVAQAFGYTEEQLLTVPDGASLGLSCGNPVASASLKEGETVLDLGSGGGIDVFLAAAKVGSTGCVVGLDMSDDMISLARKNAARKELKPPHVAFVKALLTEPLPIESNSVDCILSNCVLNLLPDEGKAAVLKEAYRVLKPGGRITLDDIVAKKILPDNIRNDIAGYIGCVAGAIPLERYQGLFEEAGFTNVVFVDTKNDLNIYYAAPGQPSATTPAGASSCCSPAPTAAQTKPGNSAQIPVKPEYEVNDWVASYQIYAIKASATPAVEIPATVLAQWWDAYPVVKSSPSNATAEEVAELIRQANKQGDAKRDFAVIDVRRNDHGGGHVRGSHNWHAQTFYDDLPKFFEEFKDTPRVFFYCQSSNGRGPRSAGWYQDYLDAHTGDHSSAAYVLKGGIKNWKATFAGQEDLIDIDEE